MRMRFTRHYKDNIQDRLMILISCRSKFIGVHVCQKLSAWSDKVIAQIKWCIFWLTV